MWKGGSGYAAVVLRGHYGGFFSCGIGDDLLDVLVTTLRWFPVGIAEAFGDCVDVELVEERLMRLLVGRGGDGCHVRGGVKQLSISGLYWRRGAVSETVE